MMPSVRSGPPVPPDALRQVVVHEPLRPGAPPLTRSVACDGDAEETAPERCLSPEYHVARKAGQPSVMLRKGNPYFAFKFVPRKDLPTPLGWGLAG